MLSHREWHRTKAAVASRRKAAALAIGSAVDRQASVVSVAAHRARRSLQELVADHFSRSSAGVAILPAKYSAKKNKIAGTFSR